MNTQETPVQAVEGPRRFYSMEDVTLFAMNKMSHDVFLMQSAMTTQLSAHSEQYRAMRERNTALEEQNRVQKERLSALEEENRHLKEVVATRAVNKEIQRKHLQEPTGVLSPSVVVMKVEDQGR